MKTKQKTIYAREWNLLSTCIDADSIKTDGEPELLGPLLVCGLLDVKQVGTIPLPALDDVHVCMARIVLRHPLQTRV